MIALITVVSTLIIFIPSSSAAPKNPKISGFFVASQNTDMKNYDMLKDIKNHGGDTVITFGYTLNKSTFQNSRQGVWSECYINKKRCIDSVKSGINVRNVLTYTGNTGFTKNKNYAPEISLFRITIEVTRSLSSLSMERVKKRLNMTL